MGIGDVMSLTRPIPTHAKDIVEFIRWWVPKPKTPPRMVHRMAGLGARYLRFGIKCKCPLGFSPLATEAAPGYPDACGLCEYPSNEWGKLVFKVSSFTNWWDEQTDAKAAVEAVWS